MSHPDKLEEGVPATVLPPTGDDSAAPFQTLSRNSKAWKLWLLWVTDAATVFARGVFAGLFPGVGGAGIVIAQTETTEASTVLVNGLLGFAGGLIVKGLENHPRPFPRRSPRRLRHAAVAAEPRLGADNRCSAMKTTLSIAAAALLAGCSTTTYERKLANGDSVKLTTFTLVTNRSVRDVKIGEDHLKASSATVDKEAAGKLIDALKVLVTP
jgi:hypothetical protein